LADVASAETLLQPESRGEHSTAPYQVILLLEPKDLWDVSWPGIITILYLRLSTKQMLMVIMFWGEVGCIADISEIFPLSVFK
jgi:hypothetical protein